MSFRKAERKRAKLRLGIVGPAGSGKTLSSLLIAYGLTKDWSKIGLVDTENGSGDLYAEAKIGGTDIGQYMVLPLSPPYMPEKYIRAIKEAEKTGLEVVILDSITHAWAGEGGLLDYHGKVSSKTGNSYTAWREVTPKHNAFVEAMLQSKIHVIASMRAKQEYVIEKDDKGKARPRKIGLAPVQRDGMDYEFTTVLDINNEHIASVSKDRTGLFDGKFFIPTIHTGEALLSWLESGKAEPSKAKQAKTEAVTPPKAKTPKTETPKQAKAETAKAKQRTPKQAEKVAETDQVSEFTLIVAGEMKQGDEAFSVLTESASGDFTGELVVDAELAIPVIELLAVPGSAITVTGTQSGDVITAQAISGYTPEKEENVLEIVVSSTPKVANTKDDGSINYCYGRHEGTKVVLRGDSVSALKPQPTA